MAILVSFFKECKYSIQSVTLCFLTVFPEIGEIVFPILA